MKQAGYSGTPLEKKLGFKPGMVVVHQCGPNELSEFFSEHAVQARQPDQAYDILICFFTEKSEFIAEIPGLLNSKKTASIWCCWPKKSSGVKTDLTEQDFRDFLLPTGLVDNKVCAVNEIWSGLRFVWRVELR